MCGDNIWDERLLWSSGTGLGGLRRWAAHRLFYRARELSMVFTCRNSWNKSNEEEYFVTCERHTCMTFTFQCPNVLLEYSHTHSFTCCLWLLPAELSSCDRDCLWPPKPKYVSSLALDRKFADGGSSIRGGNSYLFSVSGSPGLCTGGLRREA